MEPSCSAVAFIHAATSFLPGTDPMHLGERDRSGGRLAGLGDHRRTVAVANPARHPKRGAVVDIGGRWHDWCRVDRRRKVVYSGDKRRVGITSP